MRRHVKCRREVHSAGACPNDLLPYKTVQIGRHIRHRRHEYAVQDARLVVVVDRSVARYRSVPALSEKAVLPRHILLMWHRVVMRAIAVRDSSPAPFAMPPALRNLRVRRVMAKLLSREPATSRRAE